MATYQFQGTLNADQGGVAALTAVDPLGTNGFVTDTPYGQTRIVYAFNGNASPVTDQAGLSLDTTSLIPANNYSVEMVFEFSQRDNAWRRILDVQNRQSDNGFYVNPSNQLAVFPVIGGAAFTNNVYHDVVLTVASSGAVNAYLDGSSAFSTTTSVMNINNPSNLMNFFLDNVVGGGQGEYSSGRIGLVRLYDTVLTADQVAAQAVDPFAGLSTVPEPASWMLLSFVGLAFPLRAVLLRRRAA